MELTEAQAIFGRQQNGRCHYKALFDIVLPVNLVPECFFRIKNIVYHCFWSYIAQRIFFYPMHCANDSSENPCRDRT